jgi:xylulokinase
MSYLGLDIGTSGCKAVIFDAEGREIRAAARRYPLAHPVPGHAELDPELVASSCSEVMAAVADSGDPVRALGISCQGEAFTLLDAAGNCLVPAMVSSDQRAVREASALDRAEIYRTTGHTPHPIFSLCKLLWVREHLPDVWAKTERIVCLEDFLHLRLGLEPAISHSLAGRTLLFDVLHRDWDDGLLTLAGISRTQLSRPLPPGGVVGQLGKEICHRLGFAPGAIVVAGGHDQVCAALGAGASRPGTAVLGSGSVECITLPVATPVFSDELREANLCCYPHAVPGLYATLAYNLSGGNVLQALVDRWLPSCTGDPFQVLMEQVPPGPTNLLVLPYFTASGTPHFDAQTPATIFGLRLETQPGEVIGAILEGLCYELAVNLRILERSGLPVNEIRITGGGARNRFWNRLKCDVFDRPVLVDEASEGGCRGAAMLAAAATGVASLDQLAAKWSPVGQPLYPDPRTAKCHQARLDRYEAFSAAIRAISRQILPLPSLL